MKSIIESSDAFEDVLATLFRDTSFLRNEVFRIPAVRDALTIDRYRNLFNSQIKKSSSSSSSQVTIDHNTDFDRMFFSQLSRRPDLISNVLASLNSVRQNSSHMRVLSVGSRTEAELFSLVNAGFALHNIECVDLFSYTPYIKVGDIHHLDYPNNYFDITVCGWVLEFCNNVSQAAEQLARVTKSGGLICIGGMHHPSSSNLSEYNQIKRHEDRVWYCSVDAIRSSFNVQDSQWIFKSDIDEKDQDKRGDVIAIFRHEASNV